MPTGEPPTVAIVLNDDGIYVDRCWNWETGQNYALSQGLRVVAVADDGSMTIDRAQSLYDAERARYRDCYGVDETVDSRATYWDDPASDNDHPEREDTI